MTSKVNGFRKGESKDRNPRDLEISKSTLPTAITRTLTSVDDPSVLQLTKILTGQGDEIMEIILWS